MKGLKAFIKLFEPPQRSVKIKIKLLSLFVLGLGQEGLRVPKRAPIGIPASLISKKILEIRNESKLA